MNEAGAGEQLLQRGDMKAVGRRFISEGQDLILGRLGVAHHDVEDPGAHHSDKFLIWNRSVEAFPLVDPLLHHLHHLVVLMPGLSHWHQQLVDEMAFPHAVNAIDAVEALLQPGGAGLLGTDDEEDLHDAWKRRCHPALN